MRVIADRERCVGAGLCVLTDPSVFDQSDDDGRVLVLTEDVATEDIASVEQAVRLCPTQVLSASGMRPGVHDAQPRRDT
jgi:ferredoxin